MDEAKGRPSESELRAALLGALSHELRTPLTSLGMLLDLARRQAAQGGEARLDNDLLRVFELSLRELQRIADGVQEISRIERGIWQLRPEPSTIRSLIERTREALPANVTLAILDEGLDRPGRWDTERLAEALADLAVAANRLGAGTGTVTLEIRQRESGGRVEFRLRSGEPAGEPIPLGTDAGFRYYRALSVIALMGGNVVARRTSGYVEIAAEVPEEGEGS
ncbi:hypothetical protein HRbin29_02074 [bacterium HR29]|nr:hypothetical protein HRbin29_02074 [bacterium HR29]